MEDQYEGITEYDTEDGFHVMRVHYTADPLKRTEEWLAEARKATTEADWAQEMEIDFTVTKGKPWFPEFKTNMHVSTKPLTPLGGVQIIRGWDYGLTPATVHVQVTPTGRVLVLYPELQSWESGIVQHARRVQALAVTTFNGFKFYDYGDPAGNQRAQTDERTCVQVLREEYGIFVRSGPVNQEQRDIPIRKLLASLILGEPAFIVDPRNEWLIEALKGGYRRMEIAGEVIDKLDDNKYTHIVDALGYALAMLHVNDSSKDVKMPKLGSL